MSHIPVRPALHAKGCVLALIAALSILIVPGLVSLAEGPSAVILGFTPTPTSPPPTATPAPGATPGSQPEQADPVITKRGDPALAMPGEEVTFYIEATNRGQEAAVDVVVVDELPEYLEILQVTATQGTVTVEGQVVTVDVGVIGSGFVIQITIRTRVRLDAPAPIDLQNVAQLHSPNGGDHTSPPATVVVPAESLPLTGGIQPRDNSTHPGVGPALVWLSVGATLVVALLGAWLGSRQRDTV